MESKSRMRLPNLPDEIIDFQILSRLPVKSLLRFKSVCKSWCNWISDPRFSFSTVRRRLIIGPVRVRRRLIIGPVMEDEFTTCNYLESIDEEKGLVKILLEPWGVRELPLSCEPQLFRLLGSCNGFLLISLGSSIFLWNPTTRDSEKVLTYEYLACSEDVMSGLCYDSSTEDYKVIIGLRSVKFSSLVGKCWKEVDFPYIRPRFNVGPVVNGNQHWLVDRRKKGDPFQSIVVYFDAGEEKIVEMRIPNLSKDVGTDINIIFGLGELDGCLALAQWDNGSCIIHVRAMKKYNDQETWTTLFKCGNIMRFICPPLFDVLELLCITKDGEVVTMINNTKLEAYSPKQKFKRLIKTYCYCVKTAAYVESLISPRAAITNMRHKV